MTEYTPEKVTELIAVSLTWNPAECAASPVGAWHTIERLADVLEAVSAERNMLIGPDSDDRDELITAPIMRALRTARAERREALAVIAEAMPWMDRHSGVGMRAASLLSRIPEHPKED